MKAVEIALNSWLRKSLFNPTPDADLRSFNTDRPPKANSPYTVDAGHFLYETDVALQITPYESVVTKSAASTTSVAGFGDTFARLKINVLGDDYGAVAVALLPYVKLPTRKKCFYLKRDR